MDRKLLLLINQQWTSPALDRFMAAVSSFDLWSPFLVCGLIWLLWRGRFTLRICLLLAALAAGITDGLVCNPLKHWVARLRPHQALAGIRQVDLAKAPLRLMALRKPAKVTLSKLDPQAEGRSFPSSHTANTTAVCIVLALSFRQRAWFLLLVPLLVGYSRMYTGAHWPSDVGGSLLLGGAVGYLVVLGATAAWQRWAGRWLPSWQSQHPQLIPAS